METINGVWTLGLQFICSQHQDDESHQRTQPGAKQQRRSSIPEINPPRSKQGQTQRAHHYIFDVNDKGLDISGFIVQAKKRGKKRHLFRVFHDSNENGEFDKRDPLIGSTRLKNKSIANGIGGLLEPGEFGRLDIDFKQDSLSPTTRFRFLNSSGKTITSFREKTVIPSTPALLAEAMSFSTLDSSNPQNDDEWMRLWEKHCGKDAKPPYPEDCFFNLFS